MDGPRIRRTTVTLLLMLMLAGLYIGWLVYQGRLAGTDRWAGVLGAMLGLYMASHPAGNMLDILLFTNSQDRHEIFASRSGKLWLALNALVIVAAWFVIFIGVTSLVRRTS
jgi:hypothetical protein